ncbi:MAG: hypothetical protein F4Y33_15180 [Gemmatimonadales bacterium]|nr:hypothetical protein [Gemmatimonadales bacterium]
MYDTTAPTFSGSGPSGAMEGGATLGVDVSGVLKDATAGIKEYTLSIRDNSDPNSASLSPFFCEAADPVVGETRWKDVEVMGKGAKSIDIDRTLTLKRPAGGAAVTTAESFCVLLQATDATVGGISKDFSLGTFSVTWTAQAVISLTGTLGDATADTIAEAGTNTFSVALSQRPTADVTVAITGGAAGLKAAPTAAATATSLTFTAADYTTAQEITVTSEADENLAWESGTFTLTASGGGYDGVTATTASVTVNDPDVEFDLGDDPVSITEGTNAQVTITATRGDTVSAENLTVTFAGTTANTPSDDSEFTVQLGTATASNTQTLTIPSGEMSASITVTVTALQEAGDANDDSITVTISGAGDSGDHFPADGITITIVDDDKT